MKATSSLQALSYFCANENVKCIAAIIRAKGNAATSLDHLKLKRAIETRAARSAK